jgi:hypothetical protein
VLDEKLDKPKEKREIKENGENNIFFEKMILLILPTKEKKRYV